MTRKRTESDPSDDDLAALDAADQPEPEVLFDSAIAAAMMADAAHDDMKLQMRRLGERIGALFAGMVDEGMDPEAAGEISHAWMLNAVFQLTARETGTLGM